MLGSLFMSAALAWLSCCENPRIDDPAFQAVYLVGSDASATGSHIASEPVDDEMCSDEPVVYPAKPARTVVLQFRVIRAPSGQEGKIAQNQLLSSSQAQELLSSLQSDQKIEVIAEPKLVLCSGQLGTIKIGNCCQPTPGGCCDFPNLAPVAPGQNFRVSVGFGMRIGVPALGPTPIALDFGLPVASSDKPAPSVKPARCSENLELRATPVVSADGRYVRLDLEGTTSCCAGGQCETKDQTCTSRANVVCADGSTIVLPMVNCVPVPVLGDLPILGDLFRANGATPNKVMMLATVHVLKNEEGPTQTSCTRASQQVAAPPACCADGECCDTVESNLAKLQTARELFDLALLYERLDLGDVAQRIHANVAEACPGSRIACQAQQRSTELAGQVMREYLLCPNAANRAEIQSEWEKIWYVNQPSHLTPEIITSPTDRTSSRRIEAVSRAKAAEDEKFWELRKEGMTIIAESRKHFDNGETDKALEMLRKHIQQIEASGFEPEKIAILKKQPVARLQMLTMLKHNMDFAVAQKRRVVGPSAQKHGAAGEEEAEVRTKSKLDLILSSYRQACQEGDVNRARQLAIEALAIDPTCFGK